MASIQIKPLAGAVGGTAAYGFSQGGLNFFSASTTYPMAAASAAAGSALFDFVPQVKSTISQFTSITDDRMLRSIVVGVTCAAALKYQNGVNNMGLLGYALGAAAGAYVLNM